MCISLYICIYGIDKYIELVFQYIHVYIYFLFDRVSHGNNAMSCAYKQTPLQCGRRSGPGTLDLKSKNPSKLKLG